MVNRREVGFRPTARWGGRALAQAAGPATLRVTVVDPSSGVVVAAIVTVTGVDPSTSGRTIAPRVSLRSPICCPACTQFRPLQLFVSALNLTNRANYLGYSG
jgi:hypothetical protein